MEIPTKDQLVNDLKQSFQETIDWINGQPESQFNEELVSGKWTIAEHLYHLIKSTKAVSKGMLMPKLGLKAMFGKCNRQERTFDEMFEKYKAKIMSVDVDVPSAYEAAPGRMFERPELIRRFEKELEDFVKALDKWKEEEMSVYVLPHPVIGKCTIREFVYFTILHTNDHLRIYKEKYVIDSKQ